MPTFVFMIALVQKTELGGGDLKEKWCACD